MNPNATYWDHFYKSQIAPQKPSDFAQYCASYIRAKILDQRPNILDLGCGNGRDTFYFHGLGFDVTGVDPGSEIIGAPFKFLKKSFEDIELGGYGIIYLRFVVHSLKEIEFDSLLNKLSKHCKGAMLMIETRSTTGICEGAKKETNYKSAIGEAHFRMLYSQKCFENKLTTVADIIELSESDAYAVFNNERPYCIRAIGKIR